MNLKAVGLIALIAYGAHAKGMEEEFSKTMPPLSCFISKEELNDPDTYKELQNRSVSPLVWLCLQALVQGVKNKVRSKIFDEQAGQELLGTLQGLNSKSINIRQFIALLAEDEYWDFEQFTTNTWMNYAFYYRDHIDWPYYQSSFNDFALSPDKEFGIRAVGLGVVISYRILEEKSYANKWGEFPKAGFQGMECRKKMVFNADGALLAVGTNYGNIIILDVKDKWKSKKISCHNVSISDLAFAHNSSYLISSDVEGNNFVTIYDNKKNEWRSKQLPLLEKMSVVILNHDSSLVGFQHAGIDHAESNVVSILNWHDLSITKLSVGTLLGITILSKNLISNQDNSIKIYNLNGVVLKEFKLPEQMKIFRNPMLLPKSSLLFGEKITIQKENIPGYHIWGPITREYIAPAFNVEQKRYYLYKLKNLSWQELYPKLLENNFVEEICLEEKKQ